MFEPRQKDTRSSKGKPESSGPSVSERSSGKDAGDSGRSSLADVMQLQKALGNKTMASMLSNMVRHRAAAAHPAHREGVIQGNFVKFDEIHDADNGSHPIVDNRKFNTIPEPNMDQTSGATGTGKTIEPESGVNLELKTNIKWQAAKADGNGDLDGVEMVANPLGPDHKRGSAPGTGDGKDWVKRRTKLQKAASQHKYIAGHLLNHNLGGPGNAPENLAAIPDEVNHAHSGQIEEAVKDYVNNQGGWGRYTVRISHAQDNNKNNLMYANRLYAEWVPYAVEKVPDTVGNYRYEEASGSKITLDLSIQKPSYYTKKNTLAPTDNAVVAKTSSVKTPFFTPFGYDELALTPNTSLIVQFGYQNVKMIQALKVKGEDASKEIGDLKGKLKEFEERITDLEKEKEALLGQFEEHEVESEMMRKRLRAEEELRRSLEEQLQQMKERLKGVQDHGLLMGELGFGEGGFNMLMEEGFLNPFLSQPRSKATHYTTAKDDVFLIKTNMSGKGSILGRNLYLPRGTRMEQIESKTVVDPFIRVRVLGGKYNGEEGTIDKRDLIKQEFN